MHLCYSFNSSISYYLCMILKDSASWFIFPHFPADIDECAENTCSQICVNSPGSFTCYCDGKKGFKLSKDMRTCEVKYNYHFLIFLDARRQLNIFYHPLLHSIWFIDLFITLSLPVFKAAYLYSILFLLPRFIFFFSSKISKQHPLIIYPQQYNNSSVKLVVGREKSLGKLPWLKMDLKQNSYILIKYIFLLLEKPTWHRISLLERLLFAKNICPPHKIPSKLLKDSLDIVLSLTIIKYQLIIKVRVYPESKLCQN